MDVSVLVYEDHQSADMEKYNLQLSVYLFYPHSPEKFLQILMTNCFHQ